MSVKPTRRCGSVGLILLAMVCSGCGSAAGARGTVRFKGEPIAKGYLVFYPVDGNGSSAGGPIVNGAYSLPEVTPGQNRVEVTMEPADQPVFTTTEAAAAYKGPPVVSPLTPTTAGNRRVVDVAGKGQQTFDFDLGGLK